MYSEYYEGEAIIKSIDGDTLTEYSSFRTGQAEITKITDKNKKVKHIRRTFDGAGRIKISESDSIVTEYEYDNEGKIVNIHLTKL